MLATLCFAALGSAAIPAVLTLANLVEYRPPDQVDHSQELPRVAVCIPARNEEQGIKGCVSAVLASVGVQVEVLVADDHSTDATAARVASVAARDARLRLLPVPSLPPGWNGKQHACWSAALATSSPLLCFLDADVRLAPDALARMAARLRFAGQQADGAALVSGFPLEETGSFFEALLIPLIHFVLLGYLPLAMLRRTALPGFAAGCGQFLLVEREAYLASGGHSAIRYTMHDGLLLPRLLRQQGYGTRLADLTELARCRMYRTAGETWRGLAKNATEGMAAPGAILPFSLLLLLGEVLPLPLAIATAWKAPGLLPVAWAAVVLSYLPRLLELRRFRQSALSAALHPAGVATLLVLQWYAFFRKLLGRPAQWKNRKYAAN